MVLSLVLSNLLFGDPRTARVVPPTGFTATLTTLTAAAMAVLAVFALALALATGKLSQRWGDALTGTATVRVSAPADQLDVQTKAVLSALSTTPGVLSSRAIDMAETQKLLEPWLGPDLPVETLPLPRIVELTLDPATFDADSLRLRLSGEAPGAVLDDHARWRAPFVSAAASMRLLSALALGLIGAATAAMITLAAQAALSANAQVIRTLRLVGASDRYIARAFVRRFTLRALGGAAVGTALATVAVALLPAPGDAAGIMSDLGFSGWTWLYPVAIPFLAGGVAFLATRAAALRTLRSVQ